MAYTARQSTQRSFLRRATITSWTVREEPELGLAGLALHLLEFGQELLERPAALHGCLGTLNRGGATGQHPIQALQVLL